MPKIFKFAMMLSLILTLVGVLSAAEKPGRDPKISHLLTTQALITDSFSGMEITPIVRALRSWMKETSNDITILHPNRDDAVFYEMIVRGRGESALSNVSFEYPDDSEENPWRSGCKKTFYIIRTTSHDPVVKYIDGRDGDPSTGVLAFTYVGCLFKYIVVVGDRMENEEFMYITMLHELGHMWGLPDNEKGKLSVMNGMYPMAPCITKDDLREVYESFGKSRHTPKEGGCVPPGK